MLQNELNLKNTQIKIKFEKPGENEIDLHIQENLPFDISNIKLEQFPNAVVMNEEKLKQSLFPIFMHLLNRDSIISFGKDKI